MLGQALCESTPAFVRGTEGVRPGNEGDPPVPQFGQVPRRTGRAAAVVGDDHTGRLVERYRGDADIGAVSLLQDGHDPVVLGHRRRHDHAEQLLPDDEVANLRQEGVTGPVAGVNDQLQTRAAHRVQHALLHVDDIVRAWIVIDHPDQERPPEGQAARLRIGRKAVLGDHRLDPFAGLFLDEGRVVDDPRDGLLRHLGQPGDVVDGGGLAAGPSGFVH